MHRDRAPSSARQPTVGAHATDPNTRTPGNAGAPDKTGAPDNGGLDPSARPAVDQPRILDDPAEVTAEWMTRALRAGGADVEIAALRFEQIGTGQLGASYRFHLERSPGQVGHSPATVVVKMAVGDRATRARIARAYRQETGFYRTFASSARIRVPHCWSADISADGLSFTLVLEDAHPARPGRQVDGCTIEQAAVAVRNLAGLHAPFWNDRTLASRAPWLREADDAGLRFLDGILRGAADEFVRRYADELSAADAGTLLRAADEITRWGRAIRHRTSLIHGDYRLDNLMFGAAGDVVTVDWQTLEIGFPGRDLAYFLSTALSPAQRRRHEESLITAYQQRLVELGVDGYSAADCFADYRLGTLHGPMTAMIGCVYAAGTQTADSDRMFLSLATRSACAIRDLGTLELLRPS
ncbi:Aminoglycoside phosphotransferase [Frankia sp. AiPs1]|uniref:ecdysteroid 22-kinase family protein n=1 Tax=Frankia sp. AiPa1 TaxID=573492 RepID=UPI00202B1B04|nr:ecdysteroid 22-kinase family protein [Frankia sp. AiPa1]MCL9759628.1 ecdysteroid 22-kinase family protein [Frankia sp. AiPa1]